MVNPSVTPTTALLMRERDRPCSARLSRWSSGRTTRISLSSTTAVMGAGISTLRVPLGPLTSTVWPLTLVSTPFAKAMGALPIRDIVHTSLLPDVGEDFSAYTLLGSLTVGQEAL